MRTLIFAAYRFLLLGGFTVLLYLKLIAPRPNTCAGTDAHAGHGCPHCQVCPSSDTINPQ